MKNIDSQSRSLLTALLIVTIWPGIGSAFAQSASATTETGIATQSGTDIPTTSDQFMDRMLQLIDQARSASGINAHIISQKTGQPLQQKTEDYYQSEFWFDDKPDCVYVLHYTDSSIHDRDRTVWLETGSVTEWLRQFDCPISTERFESALRQRGFRRKFFRPPPSASFYFAPQTRYSRGRTHVTVRPTTLEGLLEIKWH